MGVLLRSRIFTAVVASVVTGLVVGGGVVLATHDDPEVLHACAREGNGALRLVADPADCRQGESPVSWGVVGPQGPPGADGVDGAPGADGADGSPGVLDDEELCDLEARIAAVTWGFEYSTACQALPRRTAVEGSFDVVNQAGERWHMELGVKDHGDGVVTGFLSQSYQSFRIDMTAICANISGDTARVVFRENAPSPGSWPTGWYWAMRLTDDLAGDSAGWEWIGTALSGQCDNVASLEPGPGGIGGFATTIVSGDIEVLG